MSKGYLWDLIKMDKWIPTRNRGIKSNQILQTGNPDLEFVSKICKSIVE